MATPNNPGQPAWRGGILRNWPIVKEMEKKAMTADLKARCEEAIKLEKNVSELYRLYSYTYSQDSEFWWTLHLEEDDHAGILTALSKSHLPFGRFPGELLALDMDGLRGTNRKVEIALKTWSETPPPEARAYRFAAEIEESVGELTLQEAVSTQPTSATMRLVQEVIGASRDHAARVKQLIVQRGLP